MKLSRMFAAAAMVAGLAALPAMGSNGALLSPMAGSVLVNGQSIVSGSAIVAGDTVATSSNGSARMVLPGGLLEAASKTNFQMEQGNQVRLNQGLINVSGLTVDVHGFRVLPASNNARFTVTALNGANYVTAVSGSVKLVSASHSYTVAAGHAMMFQDNGSNSTSAAASAGGTTSTGLAAPVAVGIAGAAAVITGVVVHVVTKNSSNSPAF